MAAPVQDVGQHRAEEQDDGDAKGQENRAGELASMPQNKLLRAKWVGYRLKGTLG